VIVPSRTVVVTPGTGGSIVVAAQQRLASMGFYAGPIDGAFGPMTSSAVATYQEDQGLPVTGRLDRRTRASLGI
jgi:peptidoglycan hydrolase-like protein with peptidoglycan-binding domain